MANPEHKDDFPSQKDIRSFLESLSEKPEGLLPATRLGYGTVEKWYRKEPSEMSAVNLLRVVLATRSQRKFWNWLNTFTPHPVTYVDETPVPPPAVGAHKAGSAKRRPA